MAGYGIITAGFVAALIAAEASIKPYINLVWAGTVTALVGFALTLIRRLRDTAIP